MICMSRKHYVEFMCGACRVIWTVEGGFNSTHRFVPVDSDDLLCSECDGRGDPVAPDIEVD